MEFTEQFIARFWSRVRKQPDGCWLWPCVKGGTGYGAVGYEQRTRNAHRVAWLITHGPISNGLFVCHRCDVKACVNPAHLFLGTCSENLRDAIAKGLWNPRTSRPHFDAAASAVIAAEHAAGRTHREIGSKYGVDASTISRTLTRLRQRENGAAL